MINRYLKIGLFLISGLSFSSNATLIGDSVEATINGSSVFTVNNDFGTGVVGLGVDLTANATDVFLQNWNFTVDVFDSGFSLGWTETTKADQFGNISGSSDLLSITISDFDWIGPQLNISNVILDSFNSSSGNSNTLFSFTNDSVTVNFSAMNNSDMYTFNIDTTPAVNAVPEPSTLAIFALGMIGLASRRYKKQS
jgi:hypothetical protein